MSERRRLAGAALFGLACVPLSVPARASAEEPRAPGEPVLMREPGEPMMIPDAADGEDVIDFDLGMINFDTVEPIAETSAGEIKGLSIAPLPGGNIARVGFTFVPGEARAAEFRLHLASEGQVASENWLYPWAAA